MSLVKNKYKIETSSHLRFDELSNLIENNIFSPDYILKASPEVTVAKPSLPPLNEFLPMVEQIWKSGIVTNNGPFHQSFEKELCNYLKVPNISVFSNGTMALLIAIKCLKLKGEVITTPYSFVATSHVISWNGLTPVFCDIDSNSLNICPERIEKSITKNTSAILATNVYGRPCDFIKIKELAKKHNLKIIYDSAHAFGVEENNKSILNEGDLSILSFHGTKVFTTFEGGAIISNSDKMKKRIDMFKNFAFEDEISVVGQGINGKMNEFQAALGLLQLKYFENWLSIRSHVYKRYETSLSGINGISLKRFPKNIKNNFSYFPIFIDEKKYSLTRDQLYKKLCEKNIYARRYFFPLISDFPLYAGLPSSKKSNLKNAHKISKSVICLPMHTHVSDKNIDKITKIIKTYSS